MNQKCIGLMAVLVLLLVLAPGAAHAQQGMPQVRADLVKGASLEGPTQVIVADLPQMSAQEAAQSAVEHPIFHGMSQAQYETLKAQAAVPGSTGKGSATLATPLQPMASEGAILTPLASTKFGGAGQGCGAGGSWIPSDMGLAAGTQFVLQAVNACVAVFDKTGVMQAGFPKNLNAFFGAAPLSAGVEIFDPRALYDWVNNRYIVSALQCRLCFTGSMLSWVDVAVSQTSDPRGAWNIYRFKIQNTPMSFPAGDFADFDTLGQDRKGIYIDFNLFNSSFSFVESVMMLLPKGTMYAGGAVTSFNFFDSITLGGLQLDSIQPANVMNKGDNPRAEFFVVSENINFGGGECSSACSTVGVIAIADPLGSPVFSGLGVSTATYSLPPNAGQPSAPSSVDTNDTRISGEVTYAAGSLFFSLNTNGTSSGLGFSHVMWFQLRPFIDDTPTYIGTEILNEDCYFCGSANNTYYGTLQPDPEGNIIMVFNYSDSGSNPVSSAYTGRRVTQAQNTMHDSGWFLQNGLATYLDGRWGDYTGTAPDLTNPNAPSIWVAASSAKLAHTWRSGIGNIRFKPTDP